MPVRLPFFLIILLANLLLVSACTKKAGTSANQASSETLSVDQLKTQGRKVYQVNCTACHAVDPKKEGAMGPAVHGASLELLEKRIMDGTYPEGYQPKRQTKIMQPLPFLKNDIKALHAYLNSND